MLVHVCYVIKAEEGEYSFQVYSHKVIVNPCGSLLSLELDNELIFQVAQVSIIA